MNFNRTNLSISLSIFYEANTLILIVNKNSSKFIILSIKLIISSIQCSSTSLYFKFKSIYFKLLRERVKLLNKSIHPWFLI